VFLYAHSVERIGMSALCCGFNRSLRPFGRASQGRMAMVATVRRRSCLCHAEVLEAFWTFFVYRSQLDNFADPWPWNTSSSPPTGSNRDPKVTI
jgi:hypothetical protein